MALRNSLFRAFNHYNKSNICASVSTVHGRRKYKNNDKHGTRNVEIVAVTLFSSVLIGTVLAEKSKDNPPQSPDKTSTTTEAGEKRPDLPTYSAEEVSKHDSKTSFWVTYKCGVYDVTAFLPSHPGGEQIYNAAGLSIEPFWNVYGMHKTPEVYALLESYRIGNLDEADVAEPCGDGLWAREPARDARLVVRTARPFNAEIPAKYQIEHFDTPNELFYVRQHMPVPQLAGSHRVRVSAAHGSARDFSLPELGQFPAARVRAALMCAGNRRSEMDKQVKPVRGIGWTGGAISNAVWSGVYLRDVLIHCGVDTEDTAGKHVILTGADLDATGVKFSTSIPLDMALSPQACVLLATHMNGAPLPPDHGYPLRAVVPGAPAVRSVKWLESITVSDQESDSHFHQKDYRSFNPSTTWESADFSAAPPVYSLPVTSAICAPAAGDAVRVRAGHITVRGYAYSGGGAKVLRVDVSADGGRTWAQAELRSDSAPAQRHYSWTLWECRVPVGSAREVELWAKATDSNFNTQPETFEHIWNIRGILGNAYHRVPVRLLH